LEDHGGGGVDVEALIEANGGLNFDDENFRHGKKTFFTLLLLEWQIIHDITNIAMSGISKLMRKKFGHKKLSNNHYEAKSKLKMLGLKA
jgi:hypothetical protein